MAPTAKQDPQALIDKHKAASGAGSDKDQAVIDRVEAQLANSPMGWLNSMLGDVSSKAASEEGAAKEKADEYDDEVEKNKKDAPPDAGAPPPKGSAAKPSVNTPATANQKDGGPPGKKGADGGKGKQPDKAGGKGAAKGGGKGAAAGPVGDSLIAKLAAGDGDIGAALDAYTPKSPEAKENLAKIAQMAKIAEGFKGSLDMYVADGGMEGAIATAANWIGEGKNVAAIWANNPYKKADGALGTIMKVLSVIKSVTGLVGSICGKLGLVLTVIGLLGMIFPPIGAAVSGIARILNVVGLICDAISFVLSAVLVGLNGVKLAQLIASGASPEEKAATADLLVSEANDAAGGLISLAMQFGPKFMKGMLGKSKGILSGLIKRAKAVIGQITSKISGNVKNFVNKIVRKLGFGGVKGKLVNGVWQAEKGMMAKMGDALKNTKVVKGVQNVVTKVKGSKIWNKPADMVKGVRNKLMAKYGDSKFAKWCDNVAVKSNNFADKIDLEMKVEKWGEKVGGVGEGWDVTKKLNKGTEKIEAETAKYNKHLANQDMGDLIEERKKYLKEQAEKKQLEAAGMDPSKQRNDLKRDAHDLNKQSTQVGQATRDELEANQKKAATTAAESEANELAEKTAKEARQNDPQKYANEAAETRKKRYELENQLSVDDDKRKRLLQKGEENLLPVEKKQLEALNKKLEPLDAARKADDLGYKTMSGGSAPAELPKNTYEVGKQGYEAFKAGRDVYDTFLHFGEDRPIDRGKNWDSAETFDFKNPLKWNKSSAASNASSRAGEEAKGMMGPAVAAPEDTSKADFHNFVVKKAAQSSVAATAQQMLSRIKRGGDAAGAGGGGNTSTPAATNNNANASNNANAGNNANASNSNPAASNNNAAGNNTPAANNNASANANTPANTPPAQQNPNPSGTNSNATQSANAGATATPTPTTDTAPSEPTPTADAGAGASQGNEGGGDEGGEGGGDPLPYWPALEKDYNKALGDFGLMRKIAIEFKKAQVAAKQQAVDTLAVYGKYDEYAQKRQADAKKHAADTNAAGTTAQANTTAAGAGETSSGEGAAKQDEAKGTAGQKAAVDLPEPEVRGFWGRIIGRIKRWAKQKAAELFGWIQEKIANIILKGLCGVSMADLKAYSGALKNQQNKAKGVADTGAKTSETAAAKETEVKTTAQKETAKAEADIAECDQNTTDADTFLQDVNNFEQQLKAEAANAASFIQQVTAAVTEERNKRKQAEEKAKQDAEKAAAAAAAAAAGGANMSSADQNQSVDPSSTEPNMSVDDGSGGATDEHEGGQGEGEESDPANDQIVTDTKSYIVGAGDTAVTQLESKKDDYKNQIEAATTNKDKKMAKAIEPQADEIITEFKGHLQEVRTELEKLTGSSEDVVSAVVDQAKSVDSAIAHANQTMDSMFTSLYDKIKGSKNTLGKQVVGGINDMGAGVNDAAQKGLDWAEPGAEKAWSATKDVAGAVGNPIGDAAEWAGSKVVGGMGYVGAGAVVGLNEYGKAQANSGVPMIPY
jgi:hypothetical protein